MLDPHAAPDFQRAELGVPSASPPAIHISFATFLITSLPPVIFQRSNLSHRQSQGSLLAAKDFAVVVAAAPAAVAAVAAAERCRRLPLPLSCTACMREFGGV